MRSQPSKLLSPSSGGGPASAYSAGRAVLRQSWRGYPTSREPRRQLRPQIAARSQWSRIEALLRNRQFLMAYREARERWRTGEWIAFPVGTYWLRRFAYVPLVA